MWQKPFQSNCQAVNLVVRTDQFWKDITNSKYSLVLFSRNPKGTAPLNPELDGRFNGCSIPFQYVNPYHHELTARTCVNILGYNSNRVPSGPIEYQIGCDCVFPFAMNYRGQCIQEDECNEREAFGESANKPSNEKNINSESNSKALKTDQRSKQPQPQQQKQQQRNQQWFNNVTKTSVKNRNLFQKKTLLNKINYFENLFNLPIVWFHMHWKKCAETSSCGW